MRTIRECEDAIVYGPVSDMGIQYIWYPTNKPCGKQYMGAVWPNRGDWNTRIDFADSDRCVLWNIMTDYVLSLYPKNKLTYMTQKECDNEISESGHDLHLCWHPDGYKTPALSTKNGICLHECYMNSDETLLQYKRRCVQYIRDHNER